MDYLIQGIPWMICSIFYQKITGKLFTWNNPIKKKYLDQIKLAGGAKKLLNDTKKNFSNLSLSELISDRIIIIAKKI